MIKIDKKRSAVVFPKNQKVLEQLGENIKLACKRRGFTQVLISERTGLSRLTIRRVLQGNSGVSIGHYLGVLAVLGLTEGFTKVASDDDLGRKLQDIKLLNKRGGR
ncbi:MAG: XRE family transcriptional regulator [Cycloclasticus sp. symbiont of Poecilosclerida sp. N]|nr:MAG: XRE family transcriptional regulator [Cycloclasticus sp. symbiont of Poecilosclerida sp. N]